MKKSLVVAFFLVLFAGTPKSASAQNGTSHGTTLTWTGTANTSGHTIMGYNIYRCTPIAPAAACTLVAGTWAKIDVMVDSLTNYFDSTANLTVNTIYSYAATVVDSTGDESAYSNIVTVTTPATLPTNPNPPTGLAATQS